MILEQTLQPIGRTGVPHGSRARAICCAALLLLLACSGDAPTTPSPPPTPVPTTVTVTPAEASLSSLRETVQLAASVMDQNGNAMSGVTVTWSSSDADVATVSGNGTVTSMGNGEATITALAGTASGTAAVRVRQLAARTEIVPEAVTLEAADTARLAATVTDANGHVVEGAQIEWTSADDTVATVDSQGLVTAVANGTATVWARSGTASDSASVTVRWVVAEIVIAADSIGFAALGDTARLSATVFDRRGNVIEDADVTWTSGDTAVAAVDSLGLVTSVGNGRATITATADAVAAQAAVAVEQVPADMAVEPARVVFYDIGETAALAAHVRDANGHAIEGAAVAWASDDRSVVTVTPAGTVTASGYGTTLVRASSGAVDASAEASVLQPSPERDRQVLIELYEAAGGAGWINSDGWGTDRPLSSWHGVRTDAEGYVSHLWLVYNGLAGRLPPSLGRLRRLEELALYENRIGGDIPAELGQLRRLKKLYLSGNELTGGIPATLGELVALQDLTLSNNGLTGPIPAELGNLRDLTRLWLFENNLSGGLPKELGALALLERLSISGNELSGPLPPEWGALGSVEQLHLYGNALSGPIPPEWGGMGRLELLHLFDNSLTGRLPAELGELGALKEFIAYSNRLSGAIPPELGNLGNLENLELNSNDLTGTVPPELGRLISLGNLRLDRNRISGSIPPALGGMTNLRRLSLFENELTGPIPPELGNLDNLEVLWIGWNRLSGRIPPELANMSSLIILDAGGYDMELSGPIPPELGSMENLRDIVVFGNRLSGRIPEELGNLSTLRWLSLSSNFELEGLLPRSLLKLNLDFVDITSTEICMHQDAAFLEWWNSISEHGADDCPPERIERLALIELYEKTDGPSWTTSAGWSGTGAVGDWHGVTVGNGRVTRLSLPSNALEGPIPGDIANFTELTVLDLSDNSLAGELPVEISSLSNLTELRVNGNSGLGGILDYDLMQLAALEVLHFGGTSLCASPAPTFQAWYAGIGNASGAICGNPAEVRLGVPVVYLTQSVQTPERSVRLVEGRDALLRVFVTGDQERAFFEPEVVATVSAGGATHRVVMTRAGDRLAVAADESDLANSYNAVIPGGLIVPGATLVVEADPDGVVPRAAGSHDRFPATGEQRLDIVSVPDMEVTVVPVLEASQPDSSIFEWTDNIGDDSPEVGLFKYAFPFHGFRARSREPYVTSLDLTSDGGQWGLVLELEAVRLMDKATGYYYGAAASVNGYVRGRARLAAWASMGKAWDTELAHEVGHNLDLLHAPCGGALGTDPDFPHADGSIGTWGFDFRDGTLVSPEYRRDIMGYCYDQGWLSDYYFEKVIDYRARAEGESARLTAGATRETDVLVLWGGVVGGELRIQPPFRTTTSARLPEASGPYRLEGLAQPGREVLFSLSFTPGEDQFGDKYFFFTIPTEPGWEASLDRIVLTGPEGTVTLGAEDERALSVVTDPGSGRILGILRDWDGALPAALGRTNDLDVATTRGLAGSVRLRR